MRTLWTVLFALAGLAAGAILVLPTPPTHRQASDIAVLVSNEYAYHHPQAADAVRSDQWLVTSGSLFRRHDALWSGRPDDRSPGPRSRAGTDSAVLRAVSTDAGHADVRVSFALLVHGLTETTRTPAQDYDGVHVFLRYRSEVSTYTVSVYRRDGQVVVKKKVPGGPSNGGTYDALGQARPTTGSPGWRHIDVTVSGAPVVRLTLRVDGQPLLDVLDRGETAPSITGAGRVGLRGDNCDFAVRDFTAEPLPTV